METNPTLLSDLWDSNSRCNSSSRQRQLRQQLDGLVLAVRLETQVSSVESVERHSQLYQLDGHALAVRLVTQASSAENVERHSQQLDALIVDGSHLMEIYLSSAQSVENSYNFQNSNNCKIHDLLFFGKAGLFYARK